jgi:hypothetical protein
MKHPAFEDVTFAGQPAASPLDQGKVARPFNSPNRRFKAGDDIARADLAGTPLDFDHMAKRGFIAASPT